MTAALDLDALDLLRLGDDVLAALFDAAPDDQARETLLAAVDRQDLARREQQAPPAPAAPAPPAWRDTPAGQAYAGVGAAWFDAAHADYLGAEAECRGNLTAPGAPPRDPFPWLWQCSVRDFDRYASEELRAWRDAHPFPNLAEYRRQQAAMARDARAEAGDQGDDAHQAAGARRRSTREERDAAAADTQRRREELHARMSLRTAGAAGTVALRTPGGDGGQGVAAFTGPPGPLVLVQRPRIDGAHVLGQVHGFLQHFAVWPSDASLIAATGFLAQCHARHPKTRIPVGPYAPHWLLIGDAGSGKTWLARIMSKLAPNGQLLVEATKASFVQAIYERATPVIDETDVLFGSGQRHVAMRALLNAAYEQDQFTTYMQGRERVKVPLTTSALMAGLPKLRTATGNQLKPLLSRCLITDVVLAPDGYRPPRFDSQARAVAQLLNARLAAWMGQEVDDGIGDEVPEVPAGLGNRPAALWEPLLTAADRAGGAWPDAMRDACVRLESATGLPGADEEAAGRVDQWLDQIEAAR